MIETKRFSKTIFKNKNKSIQEKEGNEVIDNFHHLKFINM
jgi:hypothetical protein